MRTEVLVGLCVAVTHESVLFLCCPPGPDPRLVFISTSFSLRTNVVFGSGSKTATVTVEV